MRLMSRKKETIQAYTEIRDKLDTFTIVNCVSWKFPFKYIGHTAVLYKNEEIGQLMVLESTTLNKFSGVSGVQLAPFGAWLANYAGKVYVRIPKFTFQLDNKKTQDRKAQRFIRNHLGTSYPNLRTRTGRFKLYLAALDFKLFGVDWFTYKGKDTGIFCTMLVIMLLVHCGLVLDFVDAQEVTPDDVRDDGRIEAYFKNCTYGKEIRIK